MYTLTRAHNTLYTIYIYIYVDYTYVHLFTVCNIFTYCFNKFDTIL